MGPGPMPDRETNQARPGIRHCQPFTGRRDLKNFPVAEASAIVVGGTVRPGRAESGLQINSIHARKNDIAVILYLVVPPSKGCRR